MPTLAIVIPFYGRYELTRRVFRHYQALSRQCPGIRIQLLAMGSEGEASRNLAGSEAVDYFETANEPLDAKFESGIQLTRRFQPDAVTLVGSDDMISAEYFNRAMRLIVSGEADVTGLLDCFLVDLPTGETFYWPGYAHDSVGHYRDGPRSREGESLGAGRMASRSILERIDWSPYRAWERVPGGPFNDNETFLDNLRECGARIVDWRMADAGCRYWNVKTEDNFNPVQNFRASCPNQLTEAPAEGREFQSHWAGLAVCEFRQREALLPMTFDDWRDAYDSMTYEEHSRYFDAIYEQFPQQSHCTRHEAHAFFQEQPNGCRVLELGGWDGSMARILLDEFPGIVHWTNVEICRAACIAGGMEAPRYSAHTPDGWLWEQDRLPHADVLFASHSFEHLRAEQIDRLLARLLGIRAAYIEAPLAESADNFDWTGDLSTHLLEIGWRQLEERFLQHGYHVTHRAQNVRWFSR